MKLLKTLTLSAILATSTHLFAHGMMDSTFPEDGAMMMEPVGQIDVHFKMPMKLINLKLVSSSGTPIAIDFERAEEAGSHFSVMVPSLAPDTYTVHWTAMGDDGHVMKDSFGFMQH